MGIIKSLGPGQSASIVVLITLPILAHFFGLHQLFRFWAVFNLITWGIVLFFSIRLGFQYLFYRLRKRRATRKSATKGGPDV